MNSFLHSVCLPVLLCALLPLALFAEPAALENGPHIPPEFPEECVRRFAIESVSQIAADDGGGWLFVTAQKRGQPWESLYAVNVRDAERSALILENPAQAPGVFSNLCYLPQNGTLYFGIHNGSSRVNGVQLFVGEGIYTLKKDGDGAYSARGLRRFCKLEPWIARNAREAFFENPPSPDYAGFLRFLFGFADFDAEPCFVYEAKSGGTRMPLLDEDALRYLNEQGLLDALFEEEKTGYRSPFEDFLFCRDENGMPTARSAVTANRCPSFLRDGEAFANHHYFVPYRGRVFMLDNIGSVKNADGIWSPDFSKVHLLFDSDDDFSVTQPAGYAEIRAETFASPYPPRADSAPLFVWNKTLYLRDANHADFYALKKDLPFQKVRPPAEAARQASTAATVLALLSLALCALSAALFYALRKRSSARAIFRHEQGVRESISADIHDSVVQDIRAVRLDVERLKVRDESEALQKEAVRHLTDCIKKMRDICYGLSPAEIATAEASDSAVDILSVVRTLCEQFSYRTNIPFSLAADPPVAQCFVHKEAAQYITRIVTEILSNVEKHSFATSLVVLARTEVNSADGHGKPGGSRLALFFIDDGAGCDMDSLSSRADMKNHFGLRNMRQYAALCGGKIEFLSAPGDGMQVKLWVAVKEARDE